MSESKEAEAPWTEQQLDGFLKTAASLKLYRRAELQDEETGTALVKELYVDPLPSEQVLKTLMRPSTTFVIGRKGTGKSTVFQRVQAEIRQKNGYASAYVDIKTVYESSASDPNITARLSQFSYALSPGEIEKLLLDQSFLEAVITETKNQLKKRLEESLWARIKNAFSGTLEELTREFDELLDESREDRFASVLGFKERTVASGNEQLDSNSIAVKIGTTAAAAPSILIGANGSTSSQTKSSGSTEYSDLLMRVIDIKSLIRKLRDVLNKIGIKHLYVFIDDFSELPEDAMRIVVDTLLAPLNNWSEELIKFKIAGYPGRMYYGAIDVTKSDTVYLDLYDLYGTSGKSDMEEKAIDFTRRLVESRMHYFAQSSIALYCEPHESDPWELLFYATSGNPRNLGHVLYYLYQSHLIYGRRIGRRAVREAARRYYEEKIEHYFRMNKFLHESFSERSSIYSLKELLELIVRRAQELRSYRGSAIMRGIEGQPPTSHFFVPIEYEPLLSSLELNFFLTKYYEMSDRGGRKVAVFALNFGLCQKYSIEFGRPKDTREQRLYFVERIFDYTALIRSWLNKNQEIRCDACGGSVDTDQLPALRLYGMACPHCRKGTCVVTNLSRKYEALLKQISPELLLPATELGILQTLESEQRSMKAAEIAAELDTSYQMVGKRGRLLDEKGLVRRFEMDKRRAFEITDLARQSYFANQDDSLDLSTSE